MATVFSIERRLWLRQIKFCKWVCPALGYYFNDRNLKRWTNSSENTCKNSCHFSLPRLCTVAIFTFYEKYFFWSFGTGADE